jgi:hypothetical protein
VVTAATTASLFASMAAPNFDWTPAAGSPAASITGAIAIPAGYTGSFFGGTLTPGAYFGAADPAGAKWWDGWTSYAQQ